MNALAARLLAGLCGLVLLVPCGHAQGGETPAAPPLAGAPIGLSAALPLRREPVHAFPAAPWLATSGTLAALAVGGTLLVGRRRRWGWLRPRGGRAEGARELVRIASQPLTAQASLHAVRWHGEDLLLGCTPQQVTLLARHPAPAAVEEPA
jgi:hypothetical protein